MRGAVRPFYPGPLVIVNDQLPVRVSVGPVEWGVETGPLTDAEKRQFLPPMKLHSVEPARVRRRRALARRVRPL